MTAHRHLIERFYEAIRERDAPTLATTIEQGFAEHAVMRMPPSLPYGGDHAGRATIAGMLHLLITTPTPIVLPESIHCRRMVEQHDQVVAEMAFSWKAPRATSPIAMTAIEWFTFEDARVAEMLVAYGDTAACVAQLS